MALVFAAISLGLLGSFHCIGMCGPIALALPVHHYAPLKKHTGIILYNVGRLFTYSLLGILFGLLGQSFFIGGFQQAFSITIGGLLLLQVILSKVNWFNRPGVGIMYHAFAKVKSGLGNLFNKKGLRFLFLIGLLNGLLPCGLVYLGIAGAAASGNYIEGAKFMFWFGLGTAPVMYLTGFLGQFITLKFRNHIRRSVPYIVSVMALLLIVRGLNLGIPYLSPAFEKESHTVSCCETPVKTQNNSSNPVKQGCHKKN